MLQWLSPSNLSEVCEKSLIACYGLRLWQVLQRLGYHAMCSAYRHEAVVWICQGIEQTTVLG
jgi:hypothetical protein